MDFIDLGLSVKWADMNIGSESIADKGKYFSWANVNGYKPNNNGEFTNVSFDSTSYASTTGGQMAETVECGHAYPSTAEYDAAVAENKGMVPTEKQVEELLLNTDKEWVSCPFEPEDTNVVIPREKCNALQPSGLPEGFSAYMPTYSTIVFQWDGSFTIEEPVWVNIPIQIGREDVDGESIYYTSVRYPIIPYYQTIETPTIIDENGFAVVFNPNYLSEITSEPGNRSVEFSVYKAHGVNLKSKINGNQIFLPAGGCGYNSKLINGEKTCNYWSKVLSDCNSANCMASARKKSSNLVFDKEECHMGFNIRSVKN